MEVTYSKNQKNEDLKDILKQEEITTVFQPIVSLRNAQILGYEALSRGPYGTVFQNPEYLFEQAKLCGLNWDLDYLCRRKSLEAASLQLNGKLLFLNIDPDIIKDNRFHKGFTREYIKKLGLDHNDIVIEITEKSSINNFQDFKRITDTYTDQGYQIALDDTGSGFSGLRLLAELHPHYMKIDMELIRNINKKKLNQSLLGTLNDFAMSSNIKVIAEGVETLEELSTLIDLDIEFAQGYLLGKPDFQMNQINDGIEELIIKKQQKKMKKHSMYSKNDIKIGDLIVTDLCISIENTGKDLNEIFDKNPDIQGITVTENNIPKGLIMRTHFYSKLATKFGLSVFLNRSVSLLMDTKPLIVDFYTPFESVSKIVLTRSIHNQYDKIIVTKDRQYCGMTSVQRLLECTTKIDMFKAKHSNPLSGLPGNYVIETRLKEVVENREDCHIIYFDLDNFKAYNDKFGFENGDKILKTLAKLLEDNICTDENNFLGHVGGDDFVAITYCNMINQVCDAIISEFSNRIRNFYPAEDYEKGYILSKNRNGQEEVFPIMTLSIAAVYNHNHKFKNEDHLSEFLSELKKTCKAESVSNYMIL
jgi:EAL domain-containing protein (putative c-di-GMP-specific phosphodiesterase class I)/GGDEF domain-containing protein